MYKTKIINPSENTMEMMTQREQMTDTGVYETVESTPSRMDDTYVNVLE